MLKINDIKNAQIVGYCGGFLGFATIQIKLDGKLYDLCAEKNTIVVKEWNTREIQQFDMQEAV